MNPHDLADRVDAAVLAHGQFVFAIADAPPWAYTVGNAALGLPELVIVGLPQQSAHAMLNDAGAMLRSDPTAFAVGAMLERIASMPLRVGAIHDSNVRARLLGARRREERMGRDPNVVTALQLIWPDPSGGYPGEPGFDVRWAESQPLLSLPDMLQPQGRA